MMSEVVERTIPVVVVGGGPAGLAASRELVRAGVEHVVLERGRQAGQSWADYYTSLVLHTGRHLSVLPGRRFPRGTPLYVPRGAFASYLTDYARHFALPLRTGVTVVRIAPSDGGWQVETTDGRWRAHAVVIATGIASNPRRPAIEGEGNFRGTVRHSVEYREPTPFRDRTVLVVGVGNSGGEIAAELANAGVRVLLSVRSGATVVPRDILGLPAQYWSVLIARLPRALRRAISRAAAYLGELRRGRSPFPPSPHDPLDSVPLIGFALVDAIRAGRVDVRPALERLTEERAHFADGSEAAIDDVILATGFRPALRPLDGVVRTDERGFALRHDGVRSADHATLFFVGHNYDTRGALYNIARDARRVARLVRRMLGARRGVA